MKLWMTLLLLVLVSLTERSWAASSDTERAQADGRVLVKENAETPMGTFYQSSGEEHNGVCQCTITTSWSELEEYNQLQNVKSRLAKAMKLQDQMAYPLMKGEIETIQERLEVLEAHINNQSVATSVTELFRLQKQVKALVKVVNSANENTTAGALRDQIETDLAKIKKFAEKAWDRNPFTQRNFFQEQLTILRERIFEGHTEEKGTPFQGDLLPLELSASKGWCDNGEVTFGRPYTHKYIPQVRINRYNSQTRAANGDWHKDIQPLTEADRSRICYSYISSQSQMKVKCYSNYTRFVAGRAEGSEHTLERREPGFLLYQGYFIYITSSNVLTRLSPVNNIRMSIPLGLSGSRFNITADENNLWVVYNSREKIAIAEINPKTFTTGQTWETGRSWRGVCAYFMMCGKLYTLSDCKGYSDGRVTANYVYNTATSTGHSVDYHIPSLYRGLRNLAFNSRERLVFGWDEGHMVTYPVIWSNSLS